MWRQISEITSVQISGLKTLIDIIFHKQKNKQGERKSAERRQREKEKQRGEINLKFAALC